MTSHPCTTAGGFCFCWSTLVNLMQLSKPAKITVAIFTAWPILYMFLFMAFVFSSVFFLPQHSEAQEQSFFIFPIVFGLHFLTMLSIVGLIAFYVTYIFKTDRVEQDKKALWAVVIFLGNMFAMPVFWYLFRIRE